MCQWLSGTGAVRATRVLYSAKLRCLRAPNKANDLRPAVRLRPFMAVHCRS
jgi:hypothetical protein